MDITEVRVLALAEMNKWGLIKDGWSFSFNRALTYAGICYLGEEKEIRLSKPIMQVKDQAFVLDTIRHEIAHALSDDHTHGSEWQKWARKVGCSIAATYRSCKKEKDLRKERTKYVMCYKGLIVKRYLRKPAQKTFSNIKGHWLKGIKEESKGKLYIEAYNPKIHVKEYKPA